MPKDALIVHVDFSSFRLRDLPGLGQLLRGGSHAERSEMLPCWIAGGQARASYEEFVERTCALVASIRAWTNLLCWNAVARLTPPRAV